MLSRNDFIKQSLALHLFFARIMMEHAFILEIRFTSKDSSLINQADYYRKAFENLLVNAIALSNGVVDTAILQSGEIITPYTLQAEVASSYLTGIQINTGLTYSESGLVGSEMPVDNPKMEADVQSMNNAAIFLLQTFIEFKNKVLAGVISCQLFTTSYPYLIQHTIEEANFYLQILKRLQSREDLNVEREIYTQEGSWIDFMMDHIYIYIGSLDPTERDLLVVASNFGHQFDQLANDVEKAINGILPMKEVSRENAKATEQLRNFKIQITQGLLECRIKSIILPLLSDHLLREANHYLRLLSAHEKSLQSSSTT